MYSDQGFRPRPVDEVIEDLDMALGTYGAGVRTIFLADGNSAALPTDRLVAIGEAAQSRFPMLERITVYGSAKFLVKKSQEAWRRIAEAGVRRIHSGLESGDLQTLTDINKGVDPDEAVEAFRHVKGAGIELSVYLMVGVAGVERSAAHAEGSAAVLNQAPPDFVRLRTFVPMPGTPWHERWAEGRLTLPDPYQALTEVRLLVERLEGPTFLTSDHISNFFDATGRIPEDRERLLAEIDEALGWPRVRFRPPTEQFIGHML
jgi:radical SAM superfamily enzyme YgiQ (UPF0313 family)